MKRISVLLLALCCFIVTRSDAGDPVKDDLEKLQGEWTPTTWVVGGREYPDDPSKKVQTNHIFAGKKLTAQGRTGTFTINPSNKPKTMDVDFPAVPGQAQRFVTTWTYEISGDTLKIAYGKVGEKPAPDFKGNDFYFVLIFKRKTKADEQSR
jgi:uncharacterized protein (TIGR03067 family)